MFAPCLQQVIRRRPPERLIGSQLKSSNHCRAVEAASLCEAGFERDSHDNIHGTDGKAFRALSNLRSANSTKSIAANVFVPLCSRVHSARLAYGFDGCAALPLHIFFRTLVTTLDNRLQAAQAEWKSLCATRAASMSLLRRPVPQETNISVWQKN